MIDCYIIVDYNNPVSLKYLELSLESFEPVSDLLKITPVQCTTPKTLPIRYGRNEPPIPSYVARDGKDYLRPRYFGGSFDDTPAYQAIMHSHYLLMQRIAKGEKIAIMEHDAALVNEDSFRRMIDLYWDKVDFFLPGACMEFYGMSQRLSQWVVETLEDFPFWNGRITGPFGIVYGFFKRNLIDLDEMSFLVPTKQYDQDLICYNDQNMLDALKAQGETFPPACKQFMFVNARNTSSMDYELDKLNMEHLGHKVGYEWSRDFVLIDDSNFLLDN